MRALASTLLSIQRALGLTTDNRSGNPPSRHRGRGVAIATSALMVVGSLPIAGVTAAQAAPGDTSTSEARFLGGSLLLDGVSLDDVALLASAQSSNAGVPDPDIDTASIDLTALNALNLAVPGGVSVPLGTFLQLGSVNQYTSASDNGVSRAATGAVSDAGIVDTTGSGAYPSNASLSLTPLLGEAITENIANLDLQIGAITSEATLDGATSAITRDYSIAGADLSTQVPAIGDLVNTLVGPTGVASTVDTAVNGLTGPSGALAVALSTLNPLLEALPGSDGITATVTTDIAGALNTLLDTPLTDGVVTINLRTGAITADLDALLTSAAPGTGLNNLDVGQEILSPAVITELVDSITDLLNQVPTLVETTLTTTLNAAQVNISASVDLLVIAIDAEVSGTVGQVLDHTATANVSLTVPLVGTSTVPVGTVLSALASPITNALFHEQDGVIAAVQPTVDGAVEGILTPLADAFQLINGVASLKGNVQEHSDGTYDEIALRLTVGDVLGSGGVATVDLARASVGPNAVLPAAVPVISSITPNEGPEAGGTVVTIAGTGFTGATGVTFDGTAGTELNVVSDTEITVTTPAGTAGPADVVVASPAGTSAPGIFSYLAVPVAPTITGLTPTEGPETGGTLVTVTGTGFTGATGVTFDGTAGSALDVVSDTEITVTTPAGTPGAAEVVVEHANGDSEPGEFTYLAVPTITGLTPTEGPETGGTAVTVTGTGFTYATGVTFDGEPGADFTIVNDTTITVVTPPGTPGVAVVIVEHPAGNSTPGDFTYTEVVNAPTITDITPDSGPQTGGTEVTITGTDFSGTTEVTFDGVPGTNLNIVNDTTITVVTPAGNVGLADVVVTAPEGDSAPGEFTYTEVADAPMITGIVPNSGPQTGGTEVTITGTGFTGATGVTFGENDGTAFAVVNDTTITATTPAGAVGPAEVIVLNPAGNSGPGVFTYTAAPGSPTITDITPDTGPQTGGTEVTITGTWFGLCTSVTFDGVPATNLRVVNDNTIVVTTPAGSVGTADVVVVCPLGSSNPGDFTYTAVSGNDSPTIALTGGSPLPIGLMLVLLLAGGALLTVRRIRSRA